MAAKFLGSDSRGTWSLSSPACIVARVGSFGCHRRVLRSFGCEVPTVGSDSRGTCYQHLVVIVACSEVAAAKLRWSLSSPACIVGTCCQHVFVIVACSEVVAAKFLGSDSRGTCCQHLVAIVAKGTKYFQVPFQLWLATDERSQSSEQN